MPRRLAISGHFRPSQLLGGVASSWQNLTRGLAEVTQFDPRFQDVEVTVFHGPAGVPHECDGLAYREISSRFGRFGADAKYGLWESGEFDASLFPNYFRPPILRSPRNVATIHDLLYKHLPQLASWRTRRWLSFAHGWALRSCDAVVTISQAVKDDVCRWFGDRWSDKIRPVWNAVAFERLDGDALPTANQGRPYVLGVAVDRPFKNLHTLVRAFAKLRPRFPDHCLVLAGELRSRRPKSRIHSAEVAAKMPPTVDLVRELGLTDHVKTTGFVSDAELGALYRGADCFALPSLFEGFGMPPIEALASGTPTIVSDIPSLREITLGQARLLPDPENVDEVAAALADVLANPAAARPTPAQQAEIRRQFAPRHIAAQYLQVIFDS